MSEQSLQKLPIGISDWSSIQEKNFFYVDKSAKILELISEEYKVFFSRPRRMGKSTLISRIKHYFTEGVTPAITPCPVIYLNFQQGEYKNSSQFAEALKIWLYDAYKEAGLLEQLKVALQDWSITTNEAGQQVEITPLECIKQISLDNLLIALKHISKQQALVFLIDEWDYHLSIHLNNQQLFEDLLSVHRVFYLWLRNITNIRFLMITGIMRYRDSVLFTGQDIVDISLDPYWADLVGVTEDELTKYYAPYITEAAQRLNCSEEELLTKLKEHYDGFCFDNEAKVQIYCPWSLNSFFAPLLRANPNAQPIFGNFWMNSANTAEALRKTLQSRKIDLPALLNLKHEGVILTEQELSSPQYFSQVQLFPLLAVTGYLSIQGIAEPQNGIPALCCGLPNLEVATYFEAVVREYLRDNLGLNPREESLRELQFEQIQALEEGDPLKICATLNRFLRNIRYDAFMGINEATYREFLYLWFKTCDLMARAENYNNSGRTDIEIKTQQGHAYVLELKLISYDEPRELQPDTTEAATASAEHKEELRRACLEQLNHQVLAPARQQVIKNGYGRDYFTIGAKSITALVLAIGKAQHRIVAARAFNQERDQQWLLEPDAIGTIGAIDTTATPATP